MQNQAEVSKIMLQLACCFFEFFTFIGEKNTDINIKCISEIKSFFFGIGILV